MLHGIWFFVAMTSPVTKAVQSHCRFTITQKCRYIWIFIIYIILLYSGLLTGTLSKAETRWNLISLMRITLLTFEKCALSFSQDDRVCRIRKENTTIEISFLFSHFQSVEIQVLFWEKNGDQGICMWTLNRQHSIMQFMIFLSSTSWCQEKYIISVLDANWLNSVGMQPV